MSRKNVFAATFVIAIGLGAQSFAATVFTETFVSGTANAAFSGAGSVVNSQGFNGLGGFANFFLRNDSLGNPATATILSLTGLAAHTAITISFDLAFIDSWDSTDGFATATPDIFNLTLDTVPALTATAVNETGSITGSSAGLFAVTVPPQILGFTSFWKDSGASIVYSAAHSSSSATFAFFSSGAGWQGEDNESWAIDNVTVSIAPIPLPTGLPLLASALGAVAIVRRRRA